MFPRLTSQKIIAVTLVCVQVTTLVLWNVSNPATVTRSSLAAAALALMDSMVLVSLIHSEHIRSVRPSTIALIWLFASSLFGFVQIRTLFILSGNKAVAISTTISVPLKVILILLELTRKKGSLKDATFKASEEELSSTFGRDFFWWLTSLLRRGYSSIIAVSDLDEVEHSVSSAKVHQDFVQTWERRMQNVKSLLLCLDY
jgi:ATP-binding cassette subfamily C (CFTR/MRP) protein 1